MEEKINNYHFINLLLNIKSDVYIHINQKAVSLSHLITIKGA